MTPDRLCPSVWQNIQSVGNTTYYLPWQILGWVHYQRMLAVHCFCLFNFLTRNKDRSLLTFWFLRDTSCQEWSLTSGGDSTSHIVQICQGVMGFVHQQFSPRKKFLILILSYWFVWLLGKSRLSISSINLHFVSLMDWVKTSKLPVADQKNLNYNLLVAQNFIIMGQNDKQKHVNIILLMSVYGNYTV